MAVVRRLDLQVLEKDTPHTEVNCTYSIVSDAEGRRYLQVDTYGSNMRKSPARRASQYDLLPEAVEQSRAIIAENF
jgi:hypothetical protein